MKSAIAILTFRRLPVLKTMLEGLQHHCGHHETAVFEDCGQTDGTAGFLQAGRTGTNDAELMAWKYEPTGQQANYPGMHVFMGARNLGVAKNSNRALRWFLRDTDADYLCLCNDDLFVTGDFASFYASASKDLGVEHFCFNDFTHHPSYQWITYRMRGYGVKMSTRYTGIMMAFTRPLLERVGYFDSRFGVFGQEHCDFTIRCRLAGGIRLNGQDMPCLDVEHGMLRHQDCLTSLGGPVRQHADREADQIMRQCTSEYATRHYFKPFALTEPKFAGGFAGGGIETDRLRAMGYQVVSDVAP